MRTFEWILAAWATAGALGMVARPRAPWLGWAFCAVALLLVSLQAWREGAHWQLIPLQLGLLIVAFGLVRGSGWMMTAVSLGLIVSTVALAWALPMFRLPKPTGEYAVGVRTLHLVDASRTSGPRELVTQIWYPAEAQGSPARYARRLEVSRLHSYEAEIRTNAWQNAPLAAGGEAFPLVIFGHRWGGTRTQDTFLAEELASHGYVVAATDHPGNAARVEGRDGRVVTGTMGSLIDPARGVAQVMASWNAELEVWTADDEFVLDALASASGETGWLKGRLDMSRVAAVGHSFGGASSMRLLGLDPRVKCAVNMDGWTFGGLERRTGQPVLYLYAALPRAVNPEPWLPPPGNSEDDQLERIDRAIVTASLKRYGGYEAYLYGTQHGDFTDATLGSPIQRLTYTGPIAGDRIRTMTRALVLGFLDQTLKGTGTLPEFPELHWIVRGSTQPLVEDPATANRQ